MIATRLYNPFLALQVQRNKTNVSYFGYFIVSLLDVQETAPSGNMIQENVECRVFNKYAP
jgi:hypothetical protein